MNFKKKGNGYERNISKKISLWFSKGLHDDLFWRTQSSGGRFTQRLKTGKTTKNQIGDITSTSSESEIFSDIFMIECKNYKDIKIWSMIENKESQDSILSWWNINKKKADDSNKILFLIVKQNKKNDLLFTNKSFIEFVNPSVIFYINNEKIFVYNLQNIFNIDCNKIISICKN